MPGSRVPDWFTAEPVVFSKQRNRELKGIICSGVLSFNNIPENQRGRLHNKNQKLDWVEGPNK